MVIYRLKYCTYYWMLSSGRKYNVDGLKCMCELDKDLFPKTLLANNKTLSNLLPVYYLV